MTTNDHPADSMAGATRLTRGGRLAEATSMIQRILSGGTGRAGKADAAGGRGDARPWPTNHTGGRAEGGSLAFLKDVPGTISLDVLPGSPTGLPGAGPTHGMSRHTFRSVAGERPYLLHVPQSLPPGPVPLVMMLHGGTQDGAAFAAATKMNDLADERGFIVVYPEQVTQANPMRYWNWFSPTDQCRGQGEAAILAGLVGAVASQHAIDSTQVFVAGFSAGAAMAAVLGDQYPDVFSAIGVHSGIASGAARDMVSAFAAMRHAPPSRPAPRPLRTIVFHGSDDSTVHVSNARGVFEQFCAPTDEVATIEGREHKAFTRMVAGAGEAADCEVWIVRGAGHVWCGGRPGGSYADPQAPDASAEMVRFFLAGRAIGVADAA